MDDIRNKIKELEPKTRNRKIKIRLKKLKMREKELLKLKNNYNETFKKEFRPYIETSKVNISNDNVIKEKKKNNKKNLFKKIKKRFLASFALVGTATSIIMGLSSFSSSSSYKKEDDDVMTNSSTLYIDQLQNDDNLTEREVVNNPIENVKKTDNGVRLSCIDFDTLIGFNPYFDSSLKREVKGVTFDKNGELFYVEKIDANSYCDMHSLLSNGANVISVVTTVDGNGCEGAYKITDLDEIYINDSQKVLKR